MAGQLTKQLMWKTRQWPPSGWVAQEATGVTNFRCLDRLLGISAPGRLEQQEEALAIEVRLDRKIQTSNDNNDDTLNQASAQAKGALNDVAQRELLGLNVTQCKISEI